MWYENIKSLHVEHNGMFLVMCGFHVFSSVLVGSECEFHIIWSKFDPYGARSSGYVYK